MPLNVSLLSQDSFNGNSQFPRHLSPRRNSRISTTRASTTRSTYCTRQ